MDLNGGGITRRNVSMYIARGDDADEINIEDLAEPNMPRYIAHSPINS